MNLEGKITMLKDRSIIFFLFQSTFFGSLTLIDWTSKFHVVTNLVTFATGNQNAD